MSAKPITRKMSVQHCPFCGSVPEAEPWHGDKPTKVRVGCRNDECDVRPGVTGETHLEAERRWNRRWAYFDESTITVAAP